MPIFNIFSSRSVPSGQEKATPGGTDSKESLDEEFQLPSLHRVPVLMTPELMRRKESERLRKQYHLLPSKEGMYL